MKTAEEIISYLEASLAEAYEMYDQAKGKSPQEALQWIIKASTLQDILDEVKE